MFIEKKSEGQLRRERHKMIKEYFTIVNDI